MIMTPINLSDACILLVEDDALISIDAEDMLLGLGARAVHVAHTVADAEALVGRETFDAAVLDIRIGSGRSDALALDLLARGVPFIFTSGYGEASELAPGIGDVPVVGKPYAAEALVAAFSSLSERH
jgi:DNA-binding NtrC family response regulator